MEVILFRHGPAGERADWAKTGRPDSERPLTADGRRRVRAAARGLARLLGSADLVAASPWARARATAALAAKSLKSPLLETDLLLPSSSPAALAAWLRRRVERRVVLVGHEPHLSACAARLMGGGAVSLKKAQALLLEDGVLRWSLPGRVLRALA